MKTSTAVINTSASWALSWAIGWVFGCFIVREIGLGLRYTTGGPVGGFIGGGAVTWGLGFQSALSFVFGPLYGKDPGIGALLSGAVLGAVGGGIAGLYPSTLTGINGNTTHRPPYFSA